MIQIYIESLHLLPSVIETSLISSQVKGWLLPAFREEKQNKGKKMASYGETVYSFQEAFQRGRRSAGTSDHAVQTSFCFRNKCYKLPVLLQKVYSKDQILNTPLVVFFVLVYRNGWSEVQTMNEM